MGTRRTGSHAPRSHASRKSGEEKPLLPEAPSGGSGRSWFAVGTPLVPAWSSAGLLGGEKRQGGLSPFLSWGLEQLQ